MSVPVLYFDLGDTLVHTVGGVKVPFPGVADAIEELWQRGYRIGLLSDQPPGTTEADVRQKLGDYGLNSLHFDVITISSQLDPPIYKPDPAIFQAALDAAEHAAASAETVFVTEDLGHVQAARELGWRAIHKPAGGVCTAQSGECVESLDELLALLPPLAVDLYLRDAAGDPGDDAFMGPVFWSSPDLWVRHAEDGGTEHQSPRAGQDNWFYSRIHNRGTGIARVVWVQYAVKEWAGVQFVYPGDYWPYHALAVGLNVEPDQSRVVHARWVADLVPPAGTHACWLAAAGTSGDLASAGAHVWENNDLAQKNLTILAAAGGETAELQAMLGSRFAAEPRLYALELIRPAGRSELEVTLATRDPAALGRLVGAARRHVRAREAAPADDDLTLRFLEPARVELTRAAEGDGSVAFELERGTTLTLGGRARDARPPASPACRPPAAPARLVRGKDGAQTVRFAPGRASAIEVVLAARQLVPATLCVRVPDDAKPGERLSFDLVQRGEDGRIAGGIAVNVHVSKRKATQQTQDTTTDRGREARAARARQPRASTAARTER